MIHVITAYQNDSVKYLEVYGHADFDKHGKDIVCAGISSLVMGNLTYAEKHNLGVFEATQEAGRIMVNIEESDDCLNHLLMAIVEGVILIKKQYPEYIKIEIR